MSSIEKLSIQGIRSFGPEDNRQIVNFFTPLTLILGPNGSGKTTIIECLKYITTGDMPPNCGRGGSFVHDPKIANETEVKGQVRLQFRNTQNKRMIAARSIIATQKRDKIETRTLEGQIVTKGPSGEQCSLSAKCADIDREMINSLGVSKAVLNNVIFCHQEDSNWPLSEGKALKTKFDEIFAATKYIKALDTIKKVRSELMGEVRIHKTETHHLLNNKVKSEQLTEELSNCEVRLKTSVDRMNEIKTKLEPIQEKLTMIGSKEREIQDMEIEMKNAETLIKKTEKDIEALRRKIGDAYFVGSIAELKREMERFESVADTQSDNLRTLNGKLSQLEKQCSNLQNDKSNQFREIGKLETLEQAHKKKIMERDLTIVSLAQEQDMAGYRLHGDESFQDDIVSIFLSDIQNRIHELESSYRNKKSLNDQEVEQIQRNVDDLRNHISKCQQTVSMNTDRKTKNMETVRNIVEELALVDSNAAKQQVIDSELKNLEEQVKATENSFDLESVKESVKKLQQKRKELENKLSALNTKMTAMQLEGQKRAEVELLMKDKTVKEDSVRKILNQNDDTLQQIFGNIPKENLQHSLENQLRKLTREMDSMLKNIQTFKSKLSVLETKKKFCGDQLKGKEDELNVNNEKIFSICGSDNLDETLQVLETSISELQDEKGFLIGSQVVYGKFVEKLAGTKPCCPLCQRDFKEDQEAQELKRFLQRKVEMIPEQLKTKDRTISTKQSQRTSIIEIRPLQEKISSLEREIPELKDKLKSLNTDLDSCKKSIKETEEKFESIKIEQQLISSIQPDIVRLEQHQAEILKLELKIKNLKIHLGEDSETQTMEDVGREKDEVQSQLDSTRKEIEERQEEGTAHTDKVQFLKDKINKHIALQLKYQKDQQQRVSKEEQRKKMNAEIDELDESNAKNTEQLNMLRSELQHKLDKKSQVIGKGDEELSALNKKLTNLKAKKATLDNYCHEIKKYIREGNKSKLKTHQDELKDIEKQLEQKDREVQDVTRRIASLQEEIANQKLRESELHDNLKLKKDEKDLKEQEHKFKELKNKLGSVGLQNFYKEKLRLREEENKLGQESQVILGRKGEQQAQVARLRRELDSDMFKDANRKYVNQMILLRTTELASDDLNKYFIALDTAVMKYHSTKMEELNKIIRDLWSKTYRGNDIDSIEIRSDEEATTTSTEKKRTYNYRVVMIKGEAALDMRGRCSAGQKVLASLIIRLALAETFCLNCGILALDEPTTNLDRDNIESLAQALIEIVTSRSLQRNFQLIVITHDEDFIELLSRSDTVEYFYKVHKDGHALSKVTKCVVGEMQ